MFLLAALRPGIRLPDQTYPPCLSLASYFPLTALGVQFLKKRSVFS